ncbi:MAG: geranylgeranylglycerol-phosphate geranylgeranyltransferase [Sphingobacteriaceae bacterium]|nr:geranylgeranylglycerol-phosphate geranylgeranyltransferase [Sphingobacteriaceae bacterium]
MIFTLCSMRYFVIQSIFERTYFSEVSFWLLVTSTTLIAAAGYIINDYFDVKTDIINHPETVVIDKVIKRRTAMLLHLIFSGVGLLLGAWLAYRCFALRLVLFQLVAITLLWFYSTNFKKQLLTGNLVIAFLTSIIPFMPLAYEMLNGVHVNTAFFDQEPEKLKLLLGITLLFSGFAFLTSLIREIIKDMEDFKGDIQTGCKTMPIAWGIITTKTVTFFLIIITLGVLGFSMIKLWQWQQKTASFYLIMTVFVPLSILILQVIRAKTPFQFKVASLLLKFVMLFGIAFTFIIKLIYEQH